MTSRPAAAHHLRDLARQRRDRIDRECAQPLDVAPLARGAHSAMALPRRGDLSVTGDAGVLGETGDQTDQESRSAGHRAAASVTAMNITLHSTFLPHGLQE